MVHCSLRSAASPPRSETVLDWRLRSVFGLWALGALGEGNLGNYTQQYHREEWKTMIQIELRVWTSNSQLFLCERWLKSIYHSFAWETSSCSNKWIIRNWEWNWIQRPAALRFRACWNVRCMSQCKMRWESEDPKETKRSGKSMAQIERPCFTVTLKAAPSFFRERHWDAMVELSGLLVEYQMRAWYFSLRLGRIFHEFEPNPRSRGPDSYECWQ